jgi:hypothetical protein
MGLAAKGRLSNLWTLSFLDGRHRTPGVRILGLGQFPSEQVVRMLPTATVYRLVQCFEVHWSNKIRRISGVHVFGLRIGSVAFNQCGSLVLGGYEQKRALTPVGVSSIEQS